MEVMRALWTQELVTFEGRWHRITDAGLNPMPVQRPIPIWIGGGPGSVRSATQRAGDRVLRRIARMADGWFPSVGLDGNIGGLIARLHELIREEGRDVSDVGIEGSVSLARLTPDDWREQTSAWQEAGATHISVNTAGAGFTSAAQHIDALRRFKEATADFVG
jgi:alkanesulfonate monooxygenase SsuD/methylene tetrahydromethanopterin reductase-like flavin-dependent oxidoreductase (luciferase family)